MAIVSVPTQPFAGQQPGTSGLRKKVAEFARGFRLRCAALSAVGGPCARAILEGELGAPLGTVVNAEPLENFGELHPDPNPVNAEDLIAHMGAPDAPDLPGLRDPRRRGSQHDRRQQLPGRALGQPRRARRARHRRAALSASARWAANSTISKSAKRGDNASSGHQTLNCFDHQGGDT